MKTSGQLAYAKQERAAGIAWYMRLTAIEKEHWEHVAASTDPEEMWSGFKVDLQGQKAPTKSPLAQPSGGISVRVELSESQASAIRALSLPDFAVGRALPRIGDFHGVYGALIRIQVAVRG